MKVGEKVWYVPQRGYATAAPGREMTVVKLGRVWVYLRNHEDYEWSELRIDRNQDNAVQTGYWARDKRNTVVGIVYRDQQNHFYCTERTRLWKKVERWAYRPVPPAGLTLTDLRGLIKTLGIEDEPASV